MARIITDFYELHAPLRDSWSRDDSWCMSCKTMGLYYLLNDGSRTLGDLMNGLKADEFYFGSESECHWAAAQYYIKHGKNYPYMVGWQAAIDDAADEDDDKTVGHRGGTVIQSEEFKF